MFSFFFSFMGRTKTRATRVNSKKCPIFNSKGYLCLLCPRKVEKILSDIVFAMKIFARVARVARAARVSDLAVNKLNLDLQRELFTKKTSSYAGDVKGYWKVINQALNKKSKTTHASCLNVDGKIILDNSSILPLLRPFGYTNPSN